MGRLKSRHRFWYGVFQVIDKIFGRNLGKKLTPRSRKLLYENIESHLKSQGRGEINVVQRVSSITMNELKTKFIDKNIPVVIEGGAKEWACCREWSLDYFSQQHGDDNVTIVGNDVRETPFEIVTLKEVIANINTEAKKYLRFYPLLTEHPEHLADFDYKWLRGARGKWSGWEQFQVFIGGKLSKTPVHNAMACNLFIQAYGEKKWLLYPPELSAIIDPSPGLNFHRGAPFKSENGPFDPFNPDYSGPYFLYQYIDAISVHLKPGDIFYNPPHYWHTVENPTDSIGIGYRWLSPSLSFNSAPLYTFLDMISAPFNRHVYKDRKKDYYLIHLMEQGLYDQYINEKAKVTT
ncbi:MAG: hypothetical protein ACI9P5_003744 [Saprospiraceae bacterium]|jgi:hypothetical protein